ncbi:Undecaprenyl-diphosphatase [Phycisphaerae bacterium RAS1]|nr:Undecaprenyl-diphosphatase [Phycisphaerae bacterium RAS1]
MDVLRAIVLGIVEGLTEFLPVSSTGHLILVGPLVGADLESPKWQTFIIVCQVGAIAAVLLYFWRDLLRRLFTVPRGGWGQHLLVKLLAGVLPALLLGVVVHDWMERHLEKPVPVAVALMAGAAGIWWIDSRFRHKYHMTLDDVTVQQSLAIGLIQCISMWPGVSRAAATILGGMLVGLTPRVATEFSFYLSIPTIFAAGAYSAYKHRADFTSDLASILLVGTGVAFVVALAVVAGFLQFVQRRRLTGFAIYRVILGAAVLLYALLAR